MMNESNPVTICDKRQPLQNDARAQSAYIPLRFVIIRFVTPR